MVRVSSRNRHIRALNSYSVSAALGQTYHSAYYQQAHSTITCTHR
jgi:hypothetical protein